jgi:putative heme-binding domain-containing protein
MIAGKSPGDVPAGLELAGALRIERLAADVRVYALSSTAPENVRTAATSALAALDARQHAPTLGKALMSADAPAGLRDHVAGLLARANLAETRTELLNALPIAPARLQATIAAGLADSRPGAEALLSAIAAGKASARLLLERPVASRLDRSAGDLQPKIAELTKGLPPIHARTAGLIQRRRDGFLAAKPDAALGRPLFEKHCAVCHQLDNKGTKIGPQLDGIGLRGLDRLLEDTLDPSRNVDAAFRSTYLTTKDGKALAGLLFLREDGAVLVFADSQGKEVRVAKDAVEERVVSPQSPMPVDVAEKLTEAEFQQLMAFLLSQRPR